jgi:hypothetical protein
MLDRVDPANILPWRRRADSVERYHLGAGRECNGKAGLPISPVSYLAGLALLGIRRLFPIALLAFSATAIAAERPGDAPVSLSAEQKAAVEAGVGIALTNPGSAKFGPLAAGRLGNKIEVCGWVDGKPYAGVLSNNFFSLFDIGESVGKSCQDEGLMPDAKTGKVPQ